MKGREAGLGVIDELPLFLLPEGLPQARFGGPPSPPDFPFGIIFP